MIHRLFVGLRPPRDIRADLMAIMGGIAGVRWQRDDQLHLTVRYIGEVDRRTADDVALALARLQTEAIDVALSGVGRFAKQRRTDTIWAGVTPGNTLARLHRKVDHAITGLGLPSESRAYLPHITLARLPRSLAVEQEVDAFIAAHTSLSSAAFAFGHLTLFESKLTRDGACYHIVERWPLGR